MYVSKEKKNRNVQNFLYTFPFLALVFWIIIEKLKNLRLKND